MILKSLLLCSITSFNSGGIAILNNNLETQKLNPNLRIKDNSTILDFKETMKNALEWETGVNSYYTGMVIDSYDSFAFTDDKGKQKDPITTNNIANPIGQPNITYEDKKFNYMGHSVLKNNSDIAQTGSTPIYEKDISSTVSAATTVGVSLQAGFKFKIFNTSVSTDISSTTATSQTTSKKYTIPAQNIVIPPHKQIEVNEYWSQVKMTQNVSVTMDISGWAKGVFHVHFPGGRKSVWTEMKPLGQIIYAYQKFYWPQCPSQLSVNTQTPDIINFTGVTECWDAGAGSSFNLDIGAPEPITN